MILKTVYQVSFRGISRSCDGISRSDESKYNPVVPKFTFNDPSFFYICSF